MGFILISVFIAVAAFIVVLCFIGTAKWAMSSYEHRKQVEMLRKHGEPLVLYHFQDGTYRRPMAQAWHIVGNQQSIEKFISYDELERFVRVSWIVGDQRYSETYKQRFVHRFRRGLREEGARLDLHYEKPAFLAVASKQYHYGGSRGGEIGPGK